jgi:hypothetical protein
MKGIEDVAALPTKVQIKGTCNSQFSAVHEAFAQSFNGRK